MDGGEAFSSPMIRSQSFTKSMPLSCDLEKGLPALFFPPMYMRQDN